MSIQIESALVASAQTDRAALERLIEGIWPEAYRIALTVLRDRDLAQDAAQDACASIVRSLPSLRNADTFASWMYRIVVNASIGIGRRRPPEQPVEHIVDRVAGIDVSEAIDLDNALAALPIVQRAVVVLHYYAGLNSKEIATATGLSSSTIRFHIMLARRALRDALSVEEATAPLTDEVVTNAR